MLNLRSILTPFILFLASCSSIPLQNARTSYYSGNIKEADHILEGCKGVSGKDMLLCYMERGLILHYLGSYEDSTNILLKASDLIKKQEPISVTEQSSALVINDRVTSYKGEYCERLWVHTYLMMDFLLQYKYPEALVEARQALELYDKYPGSLAGDHFTRALIALCFEEMRMPDDARIEYGKLADQMGGEVITPPRLPPGRGELVLFIAQGCSPTKVSCDVVVPPSIRISLPQYVTTPPPRTLSIHSGGRALSALTVSTDLGQTARKSLGDRSAQILARQALRAGAKEAIAREAGDRSHVTEALARVFLFLLEQADTRSWQTLPGGLTLVRIVLEPGPHDIELSLGEAQTVRLGSVMIPAGGRVYQSVRL